MIDVERIRVMIMRCFVSVFLFLLNAVLVSGNSPGTEFPAWKFENFGSQAEGSVKIGKDEMTITTRNTRNAFFESDEYSFAYIEQPFLYDDCTRSVVSVTIDNVPIGSAGIMMRSGLRQDAANVHLEVTATGDLFVFFRRLDGTSTLYKRVGDVEFPVEIRLTRQGDTFLSHYKNKEEKWVKGPTVIAETGESQLIGFYACSGNENQIGYDVETLRSMKVTFRNWNVSCEDNYYPPEKDFADMESVAANTLLRENFADGSLSNEPESVVNPIWSGIRYAELPHASDGSRYWRKRGDGVYYLGDKKWADYEVSISLAYQGRAAEASELLVMARYQSIAVYDKLLRYYGVSLKKGNEIQFGKYKSGGNTVELLGRVSVPSFDDGRTHDLKIRFIDRQYEILWDGETVITGIDADDPITYGNIGMKFSDCDMAVYRIEVIKLDDPVNGWEDNYLLDYYDTPIPDYIKQYTK